MQDLVCISHLRWGFVWQRPQHLLTRLARNYRLFFVEEPMADTTISEPVLKVYPGRTPQEVTVLCLHQPAQQDEWIGHGDPRTQDEYERQLLDYLARQGVLDPLLWLYTPMAQPFVEALTPRLLIYDVMDELAAFKGAPEALKELDRRLLATADVVFAGGASLYRSRLPYAQNIHLFPSGVETAHFAQAANGDLSRPPDLAEVPAPVLGYFGVVDERMDLPLLAHLAQTHPDWQIVLVGPVIKIAPDDLPQAPNLHYLGMKEYRDLPAYLAYFDVALVPFAMNESTRFLSPTKTLEYLAAHKPVVSTPLPDIIELYGDYIRIGETPHAFVEQVEAALAEGNEERRVRRVKEQALLARNSWDTIAGQMDEQIQARLQAKMTLPNGDWQTRFDRQRLGEAI
ncbi:MAG: glycosyl transferase [Chloroflexi bacterium]|nr:MAG: glycosyl transferase [Chloroflexota bacterium]